MWWWHDDVGWAGWLLMTAGMLAFWGALVWIFVSMMRGDQRSAQPSTRSPEDILAERFAAGELDEDEYRRRLAALRDARAGGDWSPPLPPATR